MSGLGSELAWYCPTTTQDFTDVLGNSARDLTAQSSMPVASISGSGGTHAYQTTGTQWASSTYKPFSGEAVASASCWIRPSSLGDGVILAEYRDSVLGRSLLLDIFSGEVRLQWIGNGDAVSRVDTDDAPLTIDQWSNIVATYDGTNAYLYVDDTQYGPATTATGSLDTSNDNFRICQRVAGSIGSMYLDDIRLFRSVLTASEITHLGTARAVQGAPSTSATPHPLSGLSHPLARPGRVL